MQVVDLGQQDYYQVWNMQKALHAKRADGTITDTLLLVEHNPVITLGKSGKSDNILIPETLLKEKGVDFYRIERGGDATYHGPGQLVGYPIFNIKERLAGIRSFIEKIEEVIIATLDRFSIKADKKEKMIGVWVGSGKICSIGIAVKKWVSFHGFALNVNTDLQYFDLIHPCGFKNIKMTSMAEILKKNVSMNAVKDRVIEEFSVVFANGIEERCLEEII